MVAIVPETTADVKRLAGFRNFGNSPA